MKVRNTSLNKNKLPFDYAQGTNVSQQLSQRWLSAAEATLKKNVSHGTFTKSKTKVKTMFHMEHKQNKL